MLFLVDYENVGNAGMRGSSYLNANDRVIIFYSESQRFMERRALEDITSSGCVFEICKLYQSGKNAIDFYIASRLGELDENDYEGFAIVVSNDNGFKAVKDYWERRAYHKRKVLISSCLEDGLISANENNERTRLLRSLREKLTIGGYYADYMEKIRTKKELQNLFAGTEYEDRLEQIQSLLERKDKSWKLIYLNSLHLFGRKDGLEIYHKIKMLKKCEN